MSTQFTFSFDIGHSSIGWAVLTAENKKLGTIPNILGCGSLIFPKDDCLASSRRDHRRTRRNIRATRQRIARIRTLFLHLGLLNEAELDGMGHAAPHALAARALLSEKPTLTWHELWHVLRWYAHNRGYDGNSRWARLENDNDEDTEKEKTALQLMADHGIDQNNGSMAETICATLGLDPFSKKISSAKPYKTLNAAFPRQIVRSEVLAILNKHKGALSKLDQDFIDVLIAPVGKEEKQAWKTISVPDIKLPRRYFGGLLFGQLIPRFDNRIIAICPISGEKVPNKATHEFLYYRWAMLLANIRANGKPLNVTQRQSVHALMLKKGRLTPTELRKHVEELTQTDDTNISASFEIHPDSKDALELDPALAYAQNALAPPKKRSKYVNIAQFFHLLPEVVQKRAQGRWKKGRPVHITWMLDQMTKENSDADLLKCEIDATFEEDQQKPKPSFLTRDHLLRRRFTPTQALSGRAPYSREIMRQVFDFVLSTDRHPTEKETADLPAGPIYRSKEILAEQRDKPIAELTNNHLIRQRLDLLLRLTDDMLKNYCDSDPKKVTDIIVEVASDLREFSGLTAKEMASALSKRLSHFKFAVDYLEKTAPELEINGSLIRKCRIAMDMDWHCPFTGKCYDAYDLKSLEREHIIPFADRPTNSLDSLVLTYDWVNKLKGKRTALQFINDIAGDDRFNTPKQYENFVKSLKVASSNYPDDRRRQLSRKRLLLVETFEQKDHGFTQGALTQTSHLNRLSARQLEKKFIDPETGETTVQIHSIPGQITAETRKAWNLLGSLGQACPTILHPSVEELTSAAKLEAEKELKKQIKNGNLTETDRDSVITKFQSEIPEDALQSAGETKTKTEIRGITHLHHALDAATIALTHHFLPGTFRGQAENEKGAIWTAMLKRNKTSDQVDLLIRTGMFNRHQKTNKDDISKTRPDARLRDIPTEIKAQLARRLSEQRVIQHVPADQSGAHLEQNPWRVLSIDGKSDNPTSLATITQTTSSIDDGRRVFNEKITTERVGKLIGLKPGKLSKNKAVLVIFENYGLALEPAPQIIPFHNVPKRLDDLKNRNGDNAPRIIRNGMMIHIAKNPAGSSQDYTGYWRVVSIKDNKNGPAMDIIRPAHCKAQNGVDWSGMNKTLGGLISGGLSIVHPPLTGINPDD